MAGTTRARATGLLSSLPNRAHGPALPSHLYERRLVRRRAVCQRPQAQGGVGGGGALRVAQQHRLQRGGGAWGAERKGREEGVAEVSTAVAADSSAGSGLAGVCAPPLASAPKDTSQVQCVSHLSLSFPHKNEGANRRAHSRMHKSNKGACRPRQPSNTPPRLPLPPATSPRTSRHGCAPEPRVVPHQVDQVTQVLDQLRRGGSLPCRAPGRGPATALSLLRRSGGAVSRRLRCSSVPCIALGADSARLGLGRRGPQVCHSGLQHRQALEKAGGLVLRVGGGTQGDWVQGIEIWAEGRFRHAG